MRLSRLTSSQAQHLPRESADGLIVRARLRTNLLSFARQHRHVFETFVVKPGSVLSKENRMMSVIMGLSRSVRVDELAAVLVNTALNGSETQTIEYDVLGPQGRALLKGYD